jgi:phosphopantetheinyl transferase
VGIDIEFPRSALARTAPRIFTPRELDWADSLQKKCLVWTVKESVWKAAGPELAFSEIETLHTQPSNPLSRKGVAPWAEWIILVRNRPIRWWAIPMEDGYISVGKEQPEV